MGEKICCVTGHRDLPDEKAGFIKKILKKEIEKAIEDGFTTFLSGFADGVDLYFAGIAIEKNERIIILKASIPYQKRVETGNHLFQKCLAKCDTIYICQKEYSKNCFMIRNCFMVNSSSRIIGVYDGREKGGTLCTIRYAARMKKELIMIPI